MDVFQGGGADGGGEFANGTRNVTLDLRGVAGDPAVAAKVMVMWPGGGEPLPLQAIALDDASGAMVLRVNVSLRSGCAVVMVPRDMPKK